MGLMERRCRDFYKVFIHGLLLFYAGSIKLTSLSVTPYFLTNTTHLDWSDQNADTTVVIDSYILYYTRYIHCTLEVLDTPGKKQDHPKLSNIT